MHAAMSSSLPAGLCGLMPPPSRTRPRRHTNLITAAASPEPGAPAPPPSAARLTRRDVMLAGPASSAAAAALLLASPSLPAVAAGLPAVPQGSLFPGCKMTAVPSAVIKGCWQLSGRHKGDKETDRTAPSVAAQDFPPFVDAGISTFDTGPESCGYGPSEAIIGSYLSGAGGSGAAGVQVFTKLCCIGPEQASPSKDFVSKAVSKSLARLGVDRIDNMQMYWNSLKIGGYPYMAELLAEEQAKGRVRDIGVTNFNVESVDKILSRGVGVVSNQVSYSLLDRRPENGMTDFCKAKGIAILPFGVLAGGFLTDKFLGAPESAVKLDRDSYLKYFPIIKEAGGWELYQRLLSVLRGIADKHGVSIAEVSTRWVLQKEVVPAVIVGARNARHVDDHRRLFTFQLDASDLSAIAGVLAEGARPKGDCYDYERRIGPF